MQEKVKCFVENKYFKNTIIVLIVINAITLGLETSDQVMARHGSLLQAIDMFVLQVFVVELAMKLFAYGLSFFRKPWCLFDLFVVGVALVPTSGSFSALRTLRVLRVLRLLSVVPTMRRVVEGLLAAVPGIISVVAILAIFFYVFAVIGTHLYGDTFPDWFGTLGKTMFTLFQIMTLESWSMGIVRPVMEQHSSAWVFFILYILVTTFTMLNLFIAIIVNAMHSEADDSAEKSRQEILEVLSRDIQAMEKRLLEVVSKRE